MEHQTLEVSWPRPGPLTLDSGPSLDPKHGRWPRPMPHDPNQRNDVGYGHDPATQTSKWLCRAGRDPDRPSPKWLSRRAQPWGWSYCRAKNPKPKPFATTQGVYVMTWRRGRPGIPKRGQKLQNPRASILNPAFMTPDVVICSQRGFPDVSTPSPGPVSHPESSFDSPGAR